ncbi:restriction endonuclease, partial [Patescibacteria group bacterium]
PNESSRKKLDDIPGSKPAELFTPRSIKKVNDYEIFVHEQEVIDLLQVLDGTKNDTNMLGLLDNETIKAGKLTQHVVMVLPFRASCDALEKLISKNKKLFKNIAGYKLFNISGYNQTLSTPEEIKSAIAKAELAGQKTITLTVNKMLTGSTVPQWDTMIYLKGTASPQEYDQAIFRLQSPWVEKYQDENGNIIKYDMKPQTLLVDLDPTRLFYLQEMKAFTYGANTQNIGNENIEAFIKRELAISPIIALNAEGNKLVEVTAIAIIDQVRKYANNRTITEDVQEIGIDASLKENQAIFEVISKLAELGGNGGLNIRPNDEEGEELDGVAPVEGDAAGVDGNPANTGTDGSDAADDISSFEKRFRTYYVMILLFAFLSSTEEKSLTDVIENIDANEDNRRIARNLGLKKSDLLLLRENIKPFVLSSLDYKIQNADFRANDDSITPVQHIDIAIHKFGRLSGAEVFTPSSIVNRIYDAFDEGFWRGAKDAKVLDIASKSGSFAKGFVEKAIQHGAKIKDIKDNFYSIPTSPAAYEFTRKMYTALGLNVENIARHFNSFDLIKLGDDEMQYLLSQDKKFSDIRLGDLEKPAKMKDKTNMKFTAIVGNPPYQENTGTNFAKPIYHLFFESAKALNPNYVTLIHPGRFLMNSGATPREWNRKMLNDPHLSIPIYESDFQKIFAGVDIPGGIAVTFWDKNHASGGLGGVFVASEELRSISKKVRTGGFDKIVGSAGGSPTKRYEDKYGRKRSYFRTSAFFDLKDVFSAKPDAKHTIKIVGLEKGNKRSERYVTPGVLNDLQIKKWKVLVPKSNGSGAIGEVSSTLLIGKPLIAKPLVGSTESFIQIGSFDNRVEAENCMKYIKSKFCRAMLGILKVTQDNPKSVWKNVPLQDFTKKSDIGWTKSIADIDKQLYKKYGLNKQEINFIEARVRAMD